MKLLCVNECAGGKGTELTISRFVISLLGILVRECVKLWDILHIVAEVIVKRLTEDLGLVGGHSCCCWEPVIAYQSKSQLSYF
jgi:hypothetical protein